MGVESEIGRLVKQTVDVRVAATLRLLLSARRLRGGIQVAVPETLSTERKSR